MFVNFRVDVSYYIDNVLIYQREIIAGDALNQVFGCISREALWVFDTQVMNERGASARDYETSEGYEIVESQGKDWFMTATVRGYMQDPDVELYLGTFSLRVLPGTRIWSSKPVPSDV